MQAADPAGGDSAAANIDLALKMMRGDGRPIDKAGAYTLFLKTAETGHAPRALTEAALCLWNGDGAPKDRGKALAWMRSAAEAGDPFAMIFIGGGLPAVQGVSTDPSRASAG